MSEEFEYSVAALEEYQRRTPGFDGREYMYEGKGPNITRTDPNMINIVRVLGSQKASACGCWIIIKLVPWEFRNHLRIEDNDDDNNEVSEIQVKTLRRTRN